MNTKKQVNYAMGSFCLWLLMEASAFAGSAPIMKSRCNEDSLSTPQSIERTEWSARCGHITSDERQFALTEGGKNRPRPLYPLYGTEDMRTLWHAPVDRNAPCNIPGGVQVVAFCTASCYTGDQAVLFPEGFVKIKKAKSEVLPDVMALRDASTFDNLKFASYPVESYTEEVRPNWQDIFHFTMKSGGSLKVTANHPIVDQTGVVKTADQFKVGDSLVHFQHGLDPIKSIEKMSTYGKVYNLAPNTRLPISNILVAQGYLNGSSYFQNDGQDLQNRTLLRRTLPKHLIN